MTHELLLSTEISNQRRKICPLDDEKQERLEWDKYIALPNEKTSMTKPMTNYLFL